MNAAIGFILLTMMLKEDKENKVIALNSNLMKELLKVDLLIINL